MAGRAAVPQIPAMCPRDAAHDGEAEPRAASRTVDESAEGAFFERSGKAGAFIGNIDRHAIIGGSRADNKRARMGVKPCIVDQRQHRLPDAGGIGADRSRLQIELQ